MRLRGRATAALGVALLGACGQSADEPPQAQPVADASTRPAASAPVASSSATSAPVTATRAGVGGLSGDVSALGADASGLNVRVTGLGTVLELPADALFEFDEAVLTRAAQAELGKASAMIAGSPPGAIDVIGHTDAKGDDAYNQRLSEARAQAVADWFGGQVGVRRREFQVSGRGEAEPVAPNAKPDGGDNPAGRARNRRVEVVIPRATG